MYKSTSSHLPLHFRGPPGKLASEIEEIEPGVMGTNQTRYFCKNFFLVSVVR